MRERGLRSKQKEKELVESGTLVMVLDIFYYYCSMAMMVLMFIVLLSKVTAPLLTSSAQMHKMPHQCPHDTFISPLSFPLLHTETELKMFPDVSPNLTFFQKTLSSFTIYNMTAWREQCKNEVVPIFHLFQWGIQSQLKAFYGLCFGAIATDITEGFVRT